jgi:hypothetical protein
VGVLRKKFSRTQKRVRNVGSARPTKRSYPLPPRRRQRSGSVAGKSAVSARVTTSPVAPLIVLDTGVVVRALTGRPDSASSEVVLAVQTGEVRLAVCDAFLIETTRVLREPRVESRIGSAGRAFEVALDLAFMGRHHRP